MLLAWGLAADFPCSEQRFLHEVPMGLRCCRQLNQHGALCSWSPTPLCNIRLSASCRRAYSSPSSPSLCNRNCSLQMLRWSFVPLQPAMQLQPWQWSCSVPLQPEVQWQVLLWRSAGGHRAFCCCFAALCPAHALLLARHYHHVHPCGLSPSSSSSTLCSFIAP